MKLLDLTLETPEENLALDEALLESVNDDEVLRLWEPKQVMVVVGNSSQLADEVELDLCSRSGVPVLRRPSGGAAIVTGPGCLMYSLILSYRQRPQLRSIDQAHRFVLETIAEALQLLVPNAQRAGISDLAMGSHKFSGNSLRCKREHLLYHGTLLYGFPLERLDQLLKMPPRQPDYRRHRSHGEFVANLPLDVTVLRTLLKTAFRAHRIQTDWPRELTRRLVAEKYGSPAWNQRT